MRSCFRAASEEDTFFRDADVDLGVSTLTWIFSVCEMGLSRGQVRESVTLGYRMDVEWQALSNLGASRLLTLAIHPPSDSQDIWLTAHSC